jgi:hypothetical protein
MSSIRRVARRARTTAAAAAILGFTLATATGCVAEQGAPAVAFPSPNAPQVYAVTPAPVASYTGYAAPLGVIVTAISGLPAAAALSYGMHWMTFTVTLKNTSDFSFVGIEPLVVFGQCTCDPGDYNLAPFASVEFLDTTTQAWKKITPGEVDSSGAYKNWNQIGQLNLRSHATSTLTYRMELTRANVKQISLVAGPGSLEVFLLQEPDRSRLTVGSAPDASVPLTYPVSS